MKKLESVMLQVNASDNRMYALEAKLASARKEVLDLEKALRNEHAVFLRLMDEAREAVRVP